MGRAMKDEELGAQPQEWNGGPTATGAFMSPNMYPRYAEGSTPNMHPSYPGQVGVQQVTNPTPVPSPTPIYGVPTKSNTSVLNPVLRTLGVVSSLVAVALIVADNNNYDGSVFTSASMVFLASMNAIAMLYSIIQAIAGFMSLCGAICIPSPVAEYLCLIFDAIFAVLLLACSAAAANAYQNWLDYIHSIDYVCVAAFCQQLIASIAMSFVAFIFMLCSAVRSGFLLARVSACCSS